MTDMFDKEILDEFVSESREHLETIEDDFLNLEKQKDAPDTELVNKVFRAIHTIKGSSGFLELTNIKNLAHVMETILSKIRNGDIKPELKYIDPLLSGIDMINVMIDDVQTSNDMDITEIYNKLSDLLSDNATDEDENNVPESNEVNEENVNKSEQGKPAVENEKPNENEKCDKVKRSTKRKRSVTKGQKKKAINDKPNENVDNSLISDQQPAASKDLKNSTCDNKANLLAKPSSSAERNSTIRINLNILDELMRLASELVLVRNQQLINFDKTDSKFRPIVQRLDIVTSELQETIMRTRMQPIGNVLNKFSRVVRDLGNKLGKKIDLSIVGSEVELDKTILESLADPLIHLVRNCCDHGIETPDERLKVGKTESGHILLKAYHEGGQINIEIKDDGKGINIEAIKRKVLEKNLKTESEIANMSEKEIQSLIMLPGFSTAEKLSDVSGRGVGMDVVKSNIEKLGGTIDIESKFGEGSSIHLRLPLTLAIIPSLIVKVGDYRYALPQINVVELVSLYDDEIKAKIECVGDIEIYRLRNTLLPLVRMEEVLQNPNPFTNKTRIEIIKKYHKLDAMSKVEDVKERKESFNKGIDIDEEAKPDEDNNSESSVELECRDKNNNQSHSLNFAVLKIGIHRFGLIVDRVIGTEEIVVKPMHPAIKSLHCYSGAAVMGDGKVALILDVDGIAKHAAIGLENKIADTLKEDNKTTDNELQSVLLFKSGEKEQFAVALPLIRRVEHIKMSQIEQIGNKEFITVDGVSTLVVKLDSCLNVSPCIKNDEMFLLLPKYIKKPFGILMSSLVDIMETSLEINNESYKEDGLLGTSIVRGHMTLFIDLYRLIEKAEPEWFADLQTERESQETKKRILLAEDAAFFRQLIKGYLETGGYEVDTAENGQEGIELFNEKEFDLIVSDIEMPVMNGFDFIKNIRKGKVRNNVPAVALTTLDSDKDRDNAIQCGFNKYETKFNRETFLLTVDKVLGLTNDN